MAQEHFLPTIRTCWVRVRQGTHPVFVSIQETDPLEGIAQRAIMVMPSLLLEKPHAKAGSKEFSQHLSRRLTLWKAGNIKELLHEALTIQS